MILLKLRGVSAAPNGGCCHSVAQGEIFGVVANGEADLAGRITHMNKALLA